MKLIRDNSNGNNNNKKWLRQSNLAWMVISKQINQHQLDGQPGEICSKYAIKALTNKHQNMYVLISVIFETNGAHIFISTLASILSLDGFVNASNRDMI